MEVSYTVDYNKYYRTEQYYLKYSLNARKSIQNATLVLLWFLCFLLTLPFSILSVNKGFCPSASLYIIVIFTFLIFSKSISKWCLLKSMRRHLKKSENDAVAIIQQEDSITYKNKHQITQYFWRTINDIERGEQYLLFTGPSIPFLIPRYAFHTQEDFENFYQKGREYLQACTEKQKQPERNYKILYLIPIILGFLVMSVSSSTLASEPEYVTDTERFWQDVFHSEILQSKYIFDTTDAFQNFMSQEQWEVHVQKLKEKYGDIISLYPIANVEVKKEPGRAVVILQMKGTIRACYIRTYLLNDSEEWKINGYDIITPLNVDLDEQTFSLKEDRELLKEKLPFQVQITDNSVLELSGYKQD